MRAAAIRVATGATGSLLRGDGASMPRILAGHECYTRTVIQDAIAKAEGRA